MLIRSDFKDYYDYVAAFYGKGDPKIQYHRVRFDPDKVKTIGAYDLWPAQSFRLDLPYWVKFLPSYTLSYRFRSEPKELTEFNYKWLVFAGRYYLLVQDRKEDGSAKGDWKILADPQFHAVHDYFKNNSDYKNMGEEAEELVQLSRLVAAPVFCISNVQTNRTNKDKKLKCTVTIEFKLPILDKKRFNLIFTPERAYQELDYFLSNKLRVSPDLEPPAQVADSCRLVQHGFDSKTSFRHPVK